MSTSMKRRNVLRVFAAVAAAVVVAGCSSGDRRSVESIVSFGDSLSDLGTHRWGAVEAAGGGRYTTNPATLWVEHVANHYDVAITRHRVAGAGTSTQLLGGLGYAEGGARVSQKPGVGGTPSGTPGVSVESDAMPIREQITAHLNLGRIPVSQLILVQGGGNDVFHQLLQWTVALSAGASPAEAQQAAVGAMATAGAELAADVRRLADAGALKVVVLTLADVGRTPFGYAAPEAAPLMTALSDAFNQALVAGLAGAAGVVTVDSNGFFEAVGANPAGFGFVNVTTPGCTFPVPENPASIFCTAATLAAPGAAETYLFADLVHPTAGGHREIARYVIDRIAAAIPR
jgi:outer membrane lipase/esterase